MNSAPPRWPGAELRFGVNYTPRRGWFHSWLDFDPDEVAEDFAALAGLGIDHVRCFGLWPLLQPDRGLIRGIDDLATMARIATEQGLGVFVDVLQGHLSSFDFLPSWVSTWHRRNLFTDPEVVGAQAELIGQVSSVLRQVPGALGIGLGNEFIQFAAKRHPESQALTPAQADGWLGRLFNQARRNWPEGVHTHSFDDDLWFDDDQPFTPSHATGFGDLTTVHSWIFGSVGQRHGRDAPELAWFARWLCELAAGWGPGRRIWLQEVGAPQSHLGPARAPRFITETIDILLGARGGGRSPGLDAITWWCSHDVSRKLKDFPALEHTLGLIDTDGNVKESGQAFAESIRRWRATPVAEDLERPALGLGLLTDHTDRSRSSAHGDAFAGWVRAAREGAVDQLAPTAPARRTSTPHNASSNDR